VSSKKSCNSASTAGWNTKVPSSHWQASSAIPEGAIASLQGMVSSMLRYQSIGSVQITDLQGMALASTDVSMNGKLNPDFLQSATICAAWKSRPSSRSGTTCARLLLP